MDPKIGVKSTGFQVNDSVRQRLIEAGARANMPIVIDPIGEVLAEAAKQIKAQEKELRGPQPRNRAERRHMKHGKRK